MKKYILAADDELANRIIMQESLKKDYEIQCVNDGQECLDSIVQRLPDLLLLDVAMPKVDGLEVCRRLRAGEKTQDLVIIMLSGFAMQENIDRGMQAGATAYLTKPFTPKQLRETVASYLA